MLASIPFPVLVFIVALSLGLIVCAWSISRLHKQLKKFMQGKDGTSLEATLEWLTQKHAEFDETIKVHKKALEHIDARVRRSVQAQSLIRYDAFEDSGGIQSFASALLNEDGNGYILSVVSHRNHALTYAKNVHHFIPEGQLTDEETQALEIAKETI